MHIFVDINRLNDHLSILREELTEISWLSEHLEVCRQQLALNECVDMQWIHKQQQIVNDQRACIERRMALVESMVDRFSRLNGEIADMLSDTEGKLRSELL